jgi:hypothetical protein
VIFRTFLLWLLCVTNRPIRSPSLLGACSYCKKMHDIEPDERLERLTE